MPEDPSTPTGSADVYTSSSSSVEASVYPVNINRYSKPHIIKQYLDLRGQGKISMENPSVNSTTARQPHA